RGADPHRGRFRDFVKGTLLHLVANHRKRQQKWPARLVSEEVPGDAESADREFDDAFADSWRDELLARAWAALAEADGRTGQLLYAVLRFRADHPEMRSPQMATHLAGRLGRSFTAAGVRQILHRARGRFAEFLVVEVQCALEKPTPEAIEQELADLNLLDYCRPMLARQGSRGWLEMDWREFVSRGASMANDVYSDGADSTPTRYELAAVADSSVLTTGVVPPFRALLDPPLMAGLDVAGDDGVDGRGGEAHASLPLLPGYEVVAEVGRGGMGVVYRARQSSLNRWVAIKMIHAGIDADPAARTRFRTEAEAVARLQHPHVVQIFEVGIHDGRPFLSLEYLPGGSLDSRAGNAIRPEREVARIVECLARAVQQAHERGILHRDLKPANVLLTDDGTPKITDFGLARLMDRGGTTRTDVAIGTPSYMAPEQAAGDAQRIGVTTDVYSLGALLYELLTGRAPFRGKSPLSTLEQVRTRDPIPPRRFRAPLSPDRETICLRCLEKAPGDRYPSAKSLADDLARFLAGEPVQARPVRSWRRVYRAVWRRPKM